MSEKMTRVATLAGGCFWCIEAVMQKLRGVEEAISGYTGGQTDNPSYYDVCSGQTGHAEAVEVHFDPEQISYEQLLEVFFALHDPTTLNRQDADVGTQYRSAIYYHDDEQKAAAERAIEQVNASGAYANPVVTELAPAGEFYPAEAYHNNFYLANPDYPYCTIVIDPKIKKLEKNFDSMLA